MTFLPWIVVGLLTGWMTGKILKGYGYGPLMDMVMGMTGGVAGGFMMRSGGFSFPGGTIYPTVGAILGAAVLTVLSGLASGRRWYA